MLLIKKIHIISVYEKVNPNMFKSIFFFISKQLKAPMPPWVKAKSIETNDCIVA